MFEFIRKRQIAKKTNLIYRLGYQFFYDTFEPDTTGVHIPLFVQQEHRKQYARSETKKRIDEIIRNKALDNCYKSARKYERKLMANRLRVQIKKLFHV